MKTYYERHKEERLEYQKRYNEENKYKIKERVKIWRGENREKINEYNRAYYANNKEKYLNRYRDRLARIEELEKENKKLKETIKDHQFYEEKLEHRIIELEELLH
jgi:hypothetical protein